MSERSTVTAGTWTQIGTSPATVQVISDHVSVMLACVASKPSGNDGLLLAGGPSGPNASHTFAASAVAIWAQPVSGTAVVAVQPE